MKSVSIKQLLQARGDMLDRLTNIFMHIRNAGVAGARQDLIVKEIYGMWFKILLTIEDDKVHVSISSLGYSWKVYEISFAILESGEWTAEMVLKDASIVLDAWLARIIATNLRRYQMFYPVESTEGFADFAVAMQELYPHLTITADNDRLSYHSMTPTGELLSHHQTRIGKMMTSPEGVHALYRITDYRLYASADPAAVEDLLAGIGSVLTETVIGDFTNLIMLGHLHLPTDIKIQYEDY